MYVLKHVLKLLKLFCFSQNVLAVLANYSRNQLSARQSSGWSGTTTCVNTGRDWLKRFTFCLA